MRLMFLVIAGITFANSFGQSMYYSLRSSYSFMDLRSSENKLSAYRPVVFGVAFNVSHRISETGLVDVGVNWNSTGLVYSAFDNVILKLQIPGFELSYIGLKPISRKKLLLFGGGGYYGLVVNYRTIQSNSNLLPDDAINYRLFSAFISMGYVYQLNDAIDITFDNKLNYGIKKLVPDSPIPLIYNFALGLRFGG